MQARLRTWHLQYLGRIEQELKGCKEHILTLDRLEETRPLNQSEFQFRQSCRENAYYLSSLIEERWAQRARCRWLSEGDNNTRFFHSYASSRLRQNKVLSLQVDGVCITAEDQIENAFFSHMKGILGVQTQGIPFNPLVLYERGPNLNALQDPFSSKEVEETVHSLAINRASSPDGLPNEFAKVHWNDIKSDILTLISDFFNGNEF